MCLIIANPTGKLVPENHITNAYRINDDGFGIMYANGKGKLKIIRGMFELKTVQSIFGSFHNQEIPYVAHFRMGTHGTKDESNCHPFYVSEEHGGVGLVHNGVLSGQDFNTQRNGMSDTAIFVEKLKGHIENNDFESAHLFEDKIPVVASLYGTNLGSDKLVFMAGNGYINIYNETNGDWLDNVWYSNTYSIGSYGQYNLRGYDFSAWGD